MSAQAAVDLGGDDWPPGALSRFVTAGGATWHVRELGQGPTVLLLHGTGATTHSWRALAPLLARRCHVIAPDLPGHGCTSAPRLDGFSLPAMARALAALLQTLAAPPALAVGHSAGAAILVRMALDRLIAPRLIVSINGALLPWSAIPAGLFAPLAGLFAPGSLLPELLARRAHKPGALERLLAATGSQLDARGIELYRARASSARHVAGALSMMASWNLRALLQDLPGLPVPLVLLTADGDRTIAPAQARRVQQLLPAARHLSLGGLGHLAHEERPAEIAQRLVQLATEAGVLPAGGTP